MKAIRLVSFSPMILTSLLALSHSLFLCVECRFRKTRPRKRSTGEAPPCKSSIPQGPLLSLKVSSGNLQTIIFWDRGTRRSISRTMMALLLLWRCSVRELLGALILRFRMDCPCGYRSQRLAIKRLPTLRCHRNGGPCKCRCHRFAR